MGGVTPAVKCNFFNKSQSGQGTVEYVLMLVISVTLVLGLARVIYAPFGAWAKVWLGDYVVCLLDEGKLPALMGDEETDDCAQNFIAGQGKPTTVNGGGSSNQEKNSENPSNQDSSATNSGSGGGGSSGYAGSAGRTTVSSGTDGPSENSKVTQLKEKEPGASSKYYSVSNRTDTNGARSGKPVTQLGIGGLLDSEKQRLQRRQSRIFKAGVLSPEEEGGRRDKVTRVKPSQRRQEAIESDMSSWNWGKFLRLAIILIIIVFTIFFLFLQGVRISKSLEK